MLLERSKKKTLYNLFVPLAQYDFDLGMNTVKGTVFEFIIQGGMVEQ